MSENEWWSLDKRTADALREMTPGQKMGITLQINEYVFEQIRRKIREDLPELEPGRIGMELRRRLDAGEIDAHVPSAGEWIGTVAWKGPEPRFSPYTACPEWT